MWPAIVVDELIIGDRKGLNRLPGGKSVPVQFFGSHDFARSMIYLNFDSIADKYRTPISLFIEWWK